MSARQLLQSFDTWRAAGQPLVLATVFETLGSTYTKAGHRILLAADGDYRGLVSGGCLEGDLAERARSVVASDTPVAVTYDLRDAADELWGLSIGCNGLLRVFLQPLSPARAYEPFATLAECLRGTRPAAIATVVASERAELPLGATVIVTDGPPRCFGVVASAAASIASGARRVLEEGSARLEAADGASVLYASVAPVPRLLVLGAGLDAVPLVAMAAELGFAVTVSDHRPAYVARADFVRAERVVLVEPGNLATTLPLAEFNAVVVMSHHLPTDRKYLAALAGVRVRYLGLLGPRARRDRLLAELGPAGNALRKTLRGPVGLDIGADSPESIALSVLAELQATLARRA
jgi:xanthine/CO dehydrogenase XdhC/CoxF family maturation factor